MEEIAGLLFRYYHNDHNDILFNHLIDGQILIYGENFNTRKTLSFGYYIRHDGDPIDLPYQLPFNFPLPPDWNGERGFGVTFRTKLRQVTQRGEVISEENIEYLAQIAPEFINHDWIVFPHYINAQADQGLDFFKPLPDNLEVLFHLELNHLRNNFTWNNFPNELSTWVSDTLLESLQLM